MEAVDATSEAMFSYLSMVYAKLDMSHCISCMYSSGIDCLLTQLYTLYATYTMVDAITAALLTVCSLASNGNTAFY